MSNTKKNVEKTEVFVHPGFNPTNFATTTVDYPGVDLSESRFVMNRHLERSGNGVIIVEDGIEDRQALIQSEKINAGLENIIRLQTMRYGTIENAIARNKDKQMYADVSKVPTSVAEQQDFIKKTQADVDALCVKLGISKEDLLKSTQDSLTQLLSAKQNASQSNNADGGNE